MKRILALVLCLAIALSLVLTGCGDSSDTKKSKKRSDKNDKDNTIVDSEFQDDMPENIVVTDEDFSFEGYLYEDDYSSKYFLVVTNNSRATVEFSANGVARDSEGSMIGAADFYIDVIGPGETAMGFFSFDNVKDIVSVDYTFEYENSSYYYPVFSNLSVEQTENDKNTIVKLTNNGNTCAEFVQGCILFFDSNNNVITFNNNYFTDGDSEIKPQESITTQFDSYNNYDHAEFYFTGGRSTGRTVDPEEYNVVTDSDFEITELTYTDSYSARHYVIIKNNTNKAVEISGNAVAKGSDGKAIGADSTSIDIIGPGETSIGYFYFDGCKNISTVEYDLFYDTDTYYTPVLGNLSVEQTVNDENVIVSVTNNGEIPAKFVEVYAFFFDENDNIIDVSSTYITDNDSEIKPGKTIIEQVDTYDPFAHVEVYFTGRGKE